MKLTDTQIALVFIAPMIVLFAFLNIYPIFFGISISFESRAPSDIVGEWIGIGNYIRLLNDQDFYDALIRGLIFSFGSVAVQVLMGLGIALIVRQPFKGRNIVRTLVLVPYMIPTIATALIMKWMFNDLYGLVNYALKSIGIIQREISFFGDVTTAMPTLIVANSWQFGMFATLIFLARLSTINPAFYEAAEVMGASAWRKFKDITFPSLKGVLLLVTLLRSIWMFNKFDIIFLMTKGGPVRSTTTLPVYTYIKAFLQHQMGFSASICTIAFIILIVFSIIYFVVFKPEKEIAA